jgi:hypothetical protein
MRSMKQCRERYMLHLRPDISNAPWSVEEDVVLVEGHKQHGNRYTTELGIWGVWGGGILAMVYTRQYVTQHWMALCAHC